MNKEATKDNGAAADQACGKQRLIPTTVRYPEGAMSIIRGVAEEHGCSAAELIRIATCGNLSKYLGGVAYVDAEQGKRIEELLREILTEMERIRRELNRIGVNFNQRMKLENIERKIKSTHVIRISMEYSEEKKKIEKGTNVLNKEELDTLMRRFEAAARKAGEALCHILG